MDVIRPGLAASKEQMPNNPGIAAILIPSPLERRQITRAGCVGRVAGEDIEYRLSAEASDCSAADVLKRKGECIGRLT